MVTAGSHDLLRTSVEKSSTDENSPLRCCSRSRVRAGYRERPGQLCECMQPRSAATKARASRKPVEGRLLIGPQIANLPHTAAEPQPELSLSRLEGQLNGWLYENRRSLQ